MSFPLCTTCHNADPTEHFSDIDLYGFCPERDLFYGVVCEICNAIVKPQALIQHMGTYTYASSVGTLNCVSMYPLAVKHNRVFYTIGSLIIRNLDS